MKYSHLTEETTQKVMERGVRVIGIDAVVSIDRDGSQESLEPDDVHRLFLGNGVLIVENLANVKALLDDSAYLVSFLPLNLEDVMGRQFGKSLGACSWCEYEISGATVEGVIQIHAIIDAIAIDFDIENLCS